MKKNSGSLTRTATASWQYDSADYAEGIDNSNHPSYKALTKYSGNPEKAAAGTPDSIRMGRGSLKGNTNPTGVGPRQAPTDAMPNWQAHRGVQDSLNFGRGPVNAGSTRTFDPAAGQNYRGNADQINMGRGPTRGNAQ